MHTDEDLALAQDYLKGMRRNADDEARLADLLASVRGEPPAADAATIPPAAPVEPPAEVE